MRAQQETDNPHADGKTDCENESQNSMITMTLTFMCTTPASTPVMVWHVIILCYSYPAMQIVLKHTIIR